MSHGDHTGMWKERKILRRVTQQDVKIWRRFFTPDGQKEMKFMSEELKSSYTNAITNVRFRLNRGWLRKCSTLPTSSDIVFVRFEAGPEFPAVVVNHCACYLWKKDKTHPDCTYVKRVVVKFPVIPERDENGNIIEEATDTTNYFILAHCVAPFTADTPRESL